MFVFKVEGEYDYLFISEHKCEILLRMNEQYNKLGAEKG